MQLHIAKTGNGPIPLVLLHGWGFHSAIWDSVSVHFADTDYTVYRVDLPGHGRSAMPDGAYSLKRIAAALVAAIPEPAVWLGWSISGLIALTLAHEYPQQVRALVLVTTTPRFLRDKDWPHGLTRPALQTMERRLRENYQSTLQEFVALQFSAVDYPPQQIEAITRTLCAYPTDPQALAAGAGLLASSDLRQLSTRLNCPALLLYGERDALIQAASARAWQALWPDLQTVALKNAAHLPFLSHPDEFFQALRPFLQQRLPRSAQSTKEKTTMAKKPKTNTNKKSSKAQSNLQIDQDRLEQLYQTMYRIRAFDEKVAELFHAGEIKGTAHSYVGQEAVAAGICAHLNENDYIASHHRGHGHCIAKGASMDLMMAELMGRDNGYCRGLGGSMHIADLNLNILGANGIVGASMPLSSGAALASKLRGSGQVVVAFFGDGASNQGVFHEAMNLASVWKLPMVFVCENNQYALTTSFRNTTSVEQISQRAVAYSVPGVTVDGNDVAEVFLVTQEAITRARNGEGPTLIEAMTYRWGQHSMRANLRDPRPGEEYDEWMAKDPLKRVEAQLDTEATQRVSNAANDELNNAVDFARQGPEPLRELLDTAVYAPHPQFPPAPQPNGREISFQQALNEALHSEMAHDDSVFLMGEDVGETGGIFTVSKGLFEQYGADRVRDTPISEAGFVGCGVGAAIAGMRPVVEIQIFDFVALTMDMLVNQAAKFRFMLGGKNTVPLVIRGPQGGGIRLAAQHSQSLEAWFTHIPGLVVIAPSTPYDAKGLLTAAIRDDNPVIFLEAKLLYMGSPGPVPEASYALPIGKADIKRSGSDVTVVATMAMVPRALAAAEQLEREGISVEVVDPRTLRPLDEETILTSVRKTGRLVIAHEAWTTGGFGAEVAAVVAEKALMDLDAPIRRVGALDVPMPYHDGLEREVIPSTERLLAEIRQVVEF